MWWKELQVSIFLMTNKKLMQWKLASLVISFIDIFDIWDLCLEIDMEIYQTGSLSIKIGRLYFTPLQGLCLIYDFYRYRAVSNPDGRTVQDLI